LQVLRLFQFLVQVNIAVKIGGILSWDIQKRFQLFIERFSFGTQSPIPPTVKIIPSTDDGILPLIIRLLHWAFGKGEKNTSALRITRSVVSF